MFIIILTYKKPLSEVDLHLPAHIEYLTKYYDQGLFIVSGRKVPRTGGINICTISDRALVDQIVKEDPFYLEQIADFKIIEFTPTRYHPDFAPFIPALPS